MEGSPGGGLECGRAEEVVTAAAAAGGQAVQIEKKAPPRPARRKPGAGRYLR
jgi:hypothetical protein